MGMGDSGPGENGCDSLAQRRRLFRRRALLRNPMRSRSLGLRRRAEWRKKKQNSSSWRTELHRCRSLAL